MDLKKIIKKSVKNYSQHEIWLHSAAFTYTSLLSLPALLLTVLFITKFIYADSQPVQNIIENASQVLPWESSQVLTQFLSNSVELTWFITWAITLAILLFSGTKLITFFTSAVNNSFGLRISNAKKSLWDTIKLRLYGLWFILLFIGVMWFSIIFSTVFSEFLDYPAAWYIINFLLSFIIYALLYGFILKYMSLIKMTYKQAFWGGMFIAILTIISIAIITFILSSINLTSDFALWASIVLFLLWVNYLSTVIFFGFECINVYMRENNLLQVSDLADEKYEKNIVVQSSFINKTKWVLWVLKTEWKIWAWFLKRKLKNTKKTS